MKAEPSSRLVGVSREGHACSIAAVLSVAGAKPLILIQNTGMVESGDSLRGWLLGLNIPVVLMVGYRGWTRHGVNQDSAATYTERFLMAFGINYYLVENDADAPRISIAFEEAERTGRPAGPQCRQHQLRRHRTRRRLSPSFRLSGTRAILRRPARDPRQAGPGVCRRKGRAGDRKRPDRPAPSLADPHARPSDRGPAQGIGHQRVNFTPRSRSRMNVFCAVPRNPCPITIAMSSNPVKAGPAALSDLDEIRRGAAFPPHRSGRGS